MWQGLGTQGTKKDTIIREGGILVAKSLCLCMHSKALDNTSLCAYVFKGVPTSAFLLCIVFCYPC